MYIKTYFAMSQPTFNKKMGQYDVLHPHRSFSLRFFTDPDFLQCLNPSTVISHL